MPNILILDDISEQYVTDTVSVKTTPQYTPKEQQGLSRQSSVNNINITLGNTGFVSLKVFSVPKAVFPPDSKYNIINYITSIF